jgi:hypothetical protein
MRLVLRAIGVVALSACSDSSSGPAASGPPANVLILAGGTTQLGGFGQPVPIAPTVLVIDASNRPVPDVAVTFTTPVGSGFVNPETKNTDATGAASTSWTLPNTFGTKILTARVGSLTGLIFQANAIAPDAGVLAFSLTDPAGDTLANSGSSDKGIDVVSLRGDFKRDSLIVTVTFSAPVTPGSTANSLGGVIEFDMDDNVNTGIRPASNTFGANASLGIEYQLDMFNSDGSSFALYDADDVGVPVKASFSGNTVIARIPMSRLASDDGNFSVVGVVGNALRPTDIFPNTGQSLSRRGDFNIGNSSAITAQRSLILGSPRGTLRWGERLPSSN